MNQILVAKFVTNILRLFVKNFFSKHFEMRAHDHCKAEPNLIATT